MNFSLSDEHRLMGDTLGELLAAVDVPAAVRSWADGERDATDALWVQLAEFGATALVHDERHGGIGADAGHLVAAYEQLGRHAVPGPLVESGVVAPVLLTAAAEAGERGVGGDADAGGCAAATALLEALAAGERRATVVLPPLTPLALDADAAAVVLVVADGALTLHEAPSLGGAAQPGPTPALGEVSRSVDPARRLFPAPTGAGTVLLTGDALASAVERATRLAALATAAQLVGAGRHLLDVTREYALQRRQFGREIGEFQAVKHHLADAAIALEFAWPLVLGAAVAVDAERGDGSGADADSGNGHGGTADRDVSAAKLRASVAADRVARIALQVHGAIGYTSEYDLGLWLKKVRALVGAWGTPAHHRRVVAEGLGLVAGARAPAAV